MAINTDSLHTAFRKLEIELRDSLFKMINDDKYSINAKVNDIISDKFTVNGSILEELVNDKLTKPLMNFQNSLAELIIYKAETVSKIIERDSETQDEKRVSSKMAVLMNEMSRFTHAASLDDIRSDFMNSLPGFLSRYGDVDVFLNREDERNYEDVRYYLNTYLNQLFEGYIEQIRTNISAATKAYREGVIFEVKNEFTPNDLQNRMFLGTMSKYRLKAIDGSYYFVDQITQEKVPAIKDGNNVIKSPDGALEFVYGENIFVFFDHDIVTSLSDEFISLGTRENKNEMQIRFGFDKADFFYNGVLTEDPEIIRFIISDIKHKNPVLYANQIAKNYALMEIEERVNKYSKDNEKFIVDTEGRVHINETNKTTLDSYLEALGYTIEENQDGIYLTGEYGLPERANINNGCITLDSGISITLDLYRFVDNGSPLGPEIHYTDKNSGLVAYINTDFKKISVFVDGNLHSLRIKDGKIEAREKIDGAVTSNITSAMNKIKSYFPNAVSKLETQVNIQEEYNNMTLPGDILNDEPLGENDSFEMSVPNEYQELLSEVTSTEQLEEKESNISNDGELTMSQIDDRIFELLQDPKVKEYVDLMKKASELQSMHTYEDDNAKAFL